MRKDPIKTTQQKEDGNESSALYLEGTPYGHHHSKPSEEGTSLTGTYHSQ